jgi:signal transduction histidine kinase
MSMDLFTKARLKITLLYFLLGVIILVIAGYLIYSDITGIVQNLLLTLQQLLTSRVAIDQSTAGTIIAQSINAQIRQMDISIGIWLIITMVLSAYLLAGITLRPVKRAMERQKRFMANISHELRTPLSVVRTNTEATLLGGEEATKAELREALATTIEELDLMAKIIEFLMNFSNIENRLGRLTFSTVDLVEVAKKSINLMQAAADEKNIALTFEGVESEPIPGNATALEELILNLLKNAIAYTPQGGSIRVSVMRKSGTITLSVQDSGVGIPKEDVPKIFEAFYRGQNVIGGPRKSALGIGLSIVREIATFHGATVSAKSAVGQGTLITVRFPSRISRWFF